MGVQRSPHLTLANLEYLLSEHAQAVTVGGIVWQPTRGGVAQEGIVRVESPFRVAAPYELHIEVNPLKPSEPRLQYLAGARRSPYRFSARRLCVNTPHRPYSGTHKHTPTPGGGPESAYEPNDIPPLPLQPRVAPDAYRAILEAFAAECWVRIGADFTWADP